MSQPDNVHQLRTDAVTAADLRARATPLLNQLCELVDEARAAGLNLGFGIGQDNFGRTIINQLNIVKPL